VVQVHRMGFTIRWTAFIVNSTLRRGVVCPWSLLCKYSCDGFPCGCRTECNLRRMPDRFHSIARCVPSSLPAYTTSQLPIIAPQLSRICGSPSNIMAWNEHTMLSPLTHSTDTSIYQVIHIKRPAAHHARCSLGIRGNELTPSFALLGLDSAALNLDAGYSRSWRPFRSCASKIQTQPPASNSEEHTPKGVPPADWNHLPSEFLSGPQPGSPFPRTQKAHLVLLPPCLFSRNSLGQH